MSNWSDYDRSLVERGHLTIWLSPGAIVRWGAKPMRRRGEQPQYSDLAIETALTLRLLFQLPLRQVEGSQCPRSRPMRFRRESAGSESAMTIEQLLASAESTDRWPGSMRATKSSRGPRPSGHASIAACKHPVHPSGPELIRRHDSAA
ncbi:MAG: transposase [Planctomycetota bacterium]